MKFQVPLGLMFILISFQVIGQDLTGKWEGDYQLKCPVKSKVDSIRYAEKFVDIFLKGIVNAVTTLPVTVKFTRNNSVKTMIRTGFGNTKLIKQKFHYDDNKIHVSDKKTREINRVYVIETLTKDSLVYSVMGNKCVKFILLRKK